MARFQKEFYAHLSENLNNNETSKPTSILHNALQEYFESDGLTLVRKLLGEYIEEKLKSFEVTNICPQVEGVDLISVEQTLNLTHPPIGRTTLHYWQKAGKVTAYKVGKRVFYSKKAVTTFLTSVAKSPLRN